MGRWIACAALVVGAWLAWGAARARGEAPAGPARPAEPARDAIITDFDSAPTAFTPQNLRVGLKPDPAGGDSLRIVIPDEALPPGRIRAVIFPVDPGLDAGTCTGLSVRLHSPGATASIPLRWIALDAKGRRILQRKFELKPARDPQDVTLPWVNWRWGESTGGSPSEIRKMALVVEQASPDLVLDDLRFSRAPAPPPADWLRKLAFGGRDVRSAEADGLMVATDATGAGADGLAEADVQRVLARMRQGRAFIRRVFGRAVRPVGGRAAPPSSLLIFRDRQAQGDFFRRLSRAWEVNIVQPRADGYTIQDIATATFDPRQGADRPVFLHESLHAVLARDVRLIVHDERQTWIHEGLAAYLQASVFPHTFDRAEVADRFALDLAFEGRAYRPLNRLLAVRATLPHYGQLATVVAYLVEEKSEWLPTIAEQLTGGATAEQAFEACGTNIDDVQAAWLKWGRRRFPLDGPRDQPPFALPGEFQPERKQ